MKWPRLAGWGLAVSIGLVDTTAAGPFRLGAPEVIKLDWNSRAMRAADINGDGRRDLVVVNNDRASLDFLFQLAPGDSGKAPPSTRPNRWTPVLEDAPLRLQREIVGASMFDLAVGDLDGDGRIDVAFTGDTVPLTIWYQEADGTWRTEKPPLMPAAMSATGTLLIQDVDGDGKADLVMLAREELVVLRQGEAGAWGATDKYTLVEGDSRSLTLADVNADGRVDVVYLRDQDTEPVRVRLQQAGGVFGPEMAFAHDGVRGQLRLITAGWPAGDDPAPPDFVGVEDVAGRLISLAVRSVDAENAGEAWAEPQVIRWRQSDRSDPAYVFGDFDGDGQADLAMSDADGTRVTLQLRDLKGRFAPLRSHPSFAEVRSMAAIDRDGDGADELLMLSAKEQAVGWAPITAEGGMTYPTVLEVEGIPMALAVDPGREGAEPRVALATKTDGKFWLGWYRPEGGRLAQISQVELAGAKQDVAALHVWDANRDGLPDVLVSIPRAPLRLYLGSADSQLTVYTPAAGFQSRLLAEVEPGQIGFFDLDDDGWKELWLTKDEWVRVLRLSAAGELQVVEQFSSERVGAGLAAAWARRSPGEGGNQVVLYDRKNATLELLENDGRGAFLPQDRVEMERMLVVGTGTMKAREAGAPDDVFLLGRDRFWWFPGQAETRVLTSETLYATDLPEIEFRDVAVGDLNGDGQLDLVGIDPLQNMLEILEWREDAWVPALHFKVFETAVLGPQRPAAQWQPREALITDVTGDGRNDLILLVHDRILIYPQQD